MKGYSQSSSIFQLWLCLSSISLIVRAINGFCGKKFSPSWNFTEMFGRVSWATKIFSLTQLLWEKKLWGFLYLLAPKFSVRGVGKNTNIQNVTYYTSFERIFDGEYDCEVFETKNFNFNPLWRHNRKKIEFFKKGMRQLILKLFDRRISIKRF